MKVMMIHWTQTKSQVCCFCPLQQRVPLVALFLFAYRVSVILCNKKLSHKGPKGPHWYRKRTSQKIQFAQKRLQKGPKGQKGKKGKKGPKPVQKKKFQKNAICPKRASKSSRQPCITCPELSSYYEHVVELYHYHVIL